jgi:NTP pyrophosphatase (non-canonical NTP hydrolase)
MPYAEFVGKLAKPFPIVKERLEHAYLGIIGEIGELTDTIKKHEIYGKELDQENIREELGDLRFYLQMLINEGLYQSSLTSKFAMTPRSAIFNCVYWTGKLIANDPFSSDHKIAFSMLFDNYHRLCQLLDCDPKEIIEENMAKLSKRYPDLAYSDKDAIERKDKV